jgi:hypothetical protein
MRSGKLNLEVQPVIKDITNPIFKNLSDNPIESWNNLPPLPIPTDQIKIKPGSRLLASAKANNISLDLPLIVSRSIGSNRSIAVLAEDIWRWKLQGKKDERLFDSFIGQTAKWLSTPAENKRVKIDPVKRLFTLKERVEFKGQVYDETLSPIENAEVKVNIEGEDGSYEIYLSPAGQGIYTGNFEARNAGDFSFSAEAFLGERSIGGDNGKFTISKVEIEKIERVADHNLLRLLSNLTGGNFYELSNRSDFSDDLRTGLDEEPRVTEATSEIIIWSNEIVLMIVIFLFGLEWFLRKRSGML